MVNIKLALRLHYVTAGTGDRTVVLRHGFPQTWWEWRHVIPHAVNDKSMPQTSIDNFNRVLEAWGGQYESEIYEGALHGWTVADTPLTTLRKLNALSKC